MLAPLLLLLLNTLSAAAVGGGAFQAAHQIRQKQAAKRQRRSQDLTATWQTDKSKFRYLAANTSQFLVDSLPLVPFKIPEMYSGSIAINANDSSNPGTLFFVYVPRLDGQQVNETTIWLNGGPGCDSLEGFWQENGPILWQPGTEYPVVNPYSWANLTNMLWVSQPVGTGFSEGPVVATNETYIAQNFVSWFGNWQKTFGISGHKIYVTGESYAGRYIPYISYELIQQNDTQNFNLSGALMYDPCIGNSAYPFVDRLNNVLGLNDTTMQMLSSLHESCGYASYLNQYYTFPPSGQQPIVNFNYTLNASCDVFDLAINPILEVNNCFNPYHVTDACPILWDVLGFPGNFAYNTSQLYFDRADVKAAMHAPANVSWAECSAGEVFVGGVDSSADPIQKVLPAVIEHSSRVVVGNGDLDYVITTNATMLSILNMTWNGQMGFQSKPKNQTYVPYVDLTYTDLFNNQGYAGVDGPQGIVGLHHYERGLLWVETFQSGHMQPEYQPRASYLHLNWLLGHIDSLNAPDASSNSTSNSTRRA